jgi:hypothetical protein
VAIVIPIVTEYKNTGVKKASDDIKQAQGGWAKAGAGMKAAFVPAAAVVGAFGVAAFSAFKKAEESAKVSKRLANNMKGAGFAQLTDEAEAYADSLSNLTGIDDEVIKGAQSMLALNGKIASSSQEMARATQLTADVAAAGGVSMEAAAKAISKAYDDPVKGMAAMKKAGVVLDKQQQDSIKWLVKNGRAAEAQGILLDAVGKKTKGAAEASTTSTEKMATQWENLQESLGAVFLPIVEKITKAFGGITNWITQNQTLFLTLASVIFGVAAAIVVVNAAMTAWTAATAAFAVVQTVIKAVKAWTVVQWLLNSALLANPLVLIVLAIVGLIAVLVIAYKKSDTFRRIVQTAFGAVLNAAKAAWEWIKTNWPLLLAILTGPIGIAILLITKNLDKIKAAFKAVAGFIDRLWDSVWENIKQGFQGVLDFIQRGIDAIKAAFDKVKNIASNINPFSVEGAGASAGGVISPMGVSTFADAPVKRQGSKVEITINGAVDPEGTARQIQRILDDHGKRQGRYQRPRAVAW